ncbi:hypothetical protein C8R47DRAFT_1170252 [Mycena vitilis]|nr:hypothetical protein C8R47DRAFT_1170252 [Mycena vitilis]
MAELSKDAGRAVKTLQAVQTRLSLGAATAPSAVKKTVSKTPARASRKRLCYSSDEEPKLSVPVKRPKIALNSDSGDDEKPQLRGKTAKAGQRPKQTEKAGAAHSVSFAPRRLMMSLSRTTTTTIPLRPWRWRIRMFCPNRHEHRRSLALSDTIKLALLALSLRPFFMGWCLCERGWPHSWALRVNHERWKCNPRALVSPAIAIPVCDTLFTRQNLY